jgi:branched-chain amino acid aminotransferase
LKNICFINGDFIPFQEASLKINDLAILRAYGIFDFFRTQNRRPLFIDDHLNRFIHSATHLNLHVPYSKDQMKGLISELLIRNDTLYHEFAFRLLLTGGFTEDGYTPGNPNLIIICEQYNPAPEKHFSEGIKLITHNFVRELAHIKTINYITPISLMPKIKEAGALDVLYHKDGLISEVSRSNFFIVKDSKIITSDAHILKGITRSKLLAIAREGFEVQEGNLFINDLLFADEAFITGTTKKVMPVVKIDDKIIGNGVPGPVVKELLSRFKAIEDNN